MTVRGTRACKDRKETVKGKMNGEAFANQYDKFTSPCIQISLGGKEIRSDEGSYLESAEVLSTVRSEPDMAVLIYRVSRFFPESIKKLEGMLQIGDKLEVKTGYADCVRLIFLGYIHEVEACDCGEEFLEYTIVGLDARGLMKKSNSFASSGAKKTNQILKEILENGSFGGLVQKKKISGLPECMNRDLWIKGETDYEWVSSLAAYLDYEFFGSRGELVFRKAREGAGEIGELTEEYGLKAVRTSMSLEACSGNLQICSYNRKDEKINGAFAFPGTGGPFGKNMKQLLQKYKMAQWDMELETGEQAACRAKAVMMKTARSCYKMSAVHIGLPELQPGIYISLKTSSAAGLSGTMYIEEAKHIMDSTGYRTVVRGTGK